MASFADEELMPQVHPDRLVRPTPLPVDSLELIAYGQTKPVNAEPTPLPVDSLELTALSRFVNLGSRSTTAVLRDSAAASGLSPRACDGRLSGGAFEAPEDPWGLGGSAAGPGSFHGRRLTRAVRGLLGEPETTEQKMSEQAVAYDSSCAGSAVPCIGGALIQAGGLAILAAQALLEGVHQDDEFSDLLEAMALAADDEERDSERPAGLPGAGAGVLPWATPAGPLLRPGSTPAPSSPAPGGHRGSSAASLLGSGARSAGAASPAPLGPGDRVEVWSASEGLWHRDGTVVRVAGGCTFHRGQLLAEGSLQVRYCGGSRLTWVAPGEAVCLRGPGAVGVHPQAQASFRSDGPSLDGLDSPGASDAAGSETNAAALDGYGRSPTGSPGRVVPIGFEADLRATCSAHRKPSLESAVTAVFDSGQGSGYGSRARSSLETARDRRPSLGTQASARTDGSVQRTAPGAAPESHDPAATVRDICLKMGREPPPGGRCPTYELSAFRCLDVPSDGDCFFEAFAREVARVRRAPSLGDVDSTAVMTGAELRREYVHWLQNSVSEGTQFDGVCVDTLVQAVAGVPLRDYIQLMRCASSTDRRTWGGFLDCCLLCEAHGLSAEIYERTEQGYCLLVRCGQGAAADPLRLAWLGTHFNVLQRV